MTLPKPFIDDIQPLLSPAEWHDFEIALTQSEQPTSVRIKDNSQSFPINCQRSPVPWCKEGFYLDKRPQFTLDPLLHAGAYYVQEASSMFVSHVIRTFVPAEAPLWALDLCAAPGGKSTAALQALPEGSQLVSNEIDRKRARILAENMQKWGNPNISVTANAPADFTPLGPVFDVIITDVPCSGEGMFRKDPGAVSEWSPAKVKECVNLQRQILTDIWPCLKPGGLLIYSTCTFNVHEDEEMLQYIVDHLGGEVLTIPVQPEWHIHPALTGPFAPNITPASACRFMPHFTQGEGLFMAAIRKPGDAAINPTAMHHSNKATKQQNNKRGDNNKPTKQPKIPAWLKGEFVYETDRDGLVRAIPVTHKPLHDLLVARKLYLLVSGVDLGTEKGKSFCPAHALALNDSLCPDAFPTAELDLETALNYLRREAIVLPDNVPTGYILCTYQGHKLGFVKNIGNRSNNLYPTEWRIRNL
ncbi:MAG: rRNA cytosine-C5-methyltransferase [Bacteroidales bacterium]|nr:rRNA cytosine-C5-methyltransferase [Bacteroidales bacterium]